MNLPGNSSGGEFKIDDLWANSRLKGSFSNFSAAFLGCRFPASVFLANSPWLEKPQPPPYSNWGISEMIATQHAVVQAKAYANTLKRRTTSVAKLALRDAPIAAAT